MECRCFHYNTHLKIMTKHFYKHSCSNEILYYFSLICKVYFAVYSAQINQINEFSDNVLVHRKSFSQFKGIYHKDIFDARYWFRKEFEI